ncbi:hypothetical protein [Clostridium oryzae]|uniref:Uncharacterized protein n=1 Tax=Clostridium oryzae TaxID=1450648 RepID=A0A1V4IKS3_9CLOT|nr:hypothetical protein [Clostridium oryzae]OPJ60335.1 hypothetical protein CLORY_29100 [Clostridium oryzae]
MIDVSIGIICSIAGVFATLYTVSRYFRQDTQKESGDFTRVETKLDYVSKGVDDIRLDIKDQGRQIKDITERLVKVEESTKSAHHRLDILEKEE